MLLYIAITSKLKHITILLKYIKHLFQIIILNDGTYDKPYCISQETKKLTENVTKTIERGGALRASTRSLHDIGLDNYPNPEFPEASRLTRKEEKSALQNLNNRLAGTLDVKPLHILKPIYYQYMRSFRI